MSDLPPQGSDGRSFAWRLGTLAFGALFGGVALGLWHHPEWLSYAVAAGFGLLALLCVASAVFAKGR